MSFFHHYISIVDLLLFSILTPTPSNISKMVYAFPLMIAQAIQTHPPTLFVCAVVHVDKRWRVAESGWCRVINQHNECRWAQCRWSPRSGLCHPAGSLYAPLQCLCIALTVFLGHVSLASLFNLWAFFCIIFFYNHLTLISPRRFSKYTISDIFI